MIIYLFLKDTPDYNELPGKVRAKCEGKEIFRGDYIFLSQDQYEESTVIPSIQYSRYSALSPRTKRGSPQCMREVTFEILNQDNEILIAA